MVTVDFESQTKELIDGLKSTCATYGLGNDGNEFKIITQVFLYKFLNDKFAYEVKKIDENLAKADKWEDVIATYNVNDYEILTMQLGADTATLKPEHFISHLYNRQNESDFAKLFDDTLRDIAIANNDIFAVKTGGGSKIKLFDELSQFITDASERDHFCKALVNQLTEFSFEGIFNQKYDFYATIFEYLIKDYNKDGGGKYAEYYTPHAVAKIMAAILVTEKVQNVTCYDPSAGSGTLLMNIAHAIGEDKCTLYSQDISQKSSGLLRLNLILNNLVHSIPNIIKGNTIKEPYHKDEDGSLMKFDYIVSNPPFNLDFSDFRDELDTKENHERFFAGIPNIPKKKLDSMDIYIMFLQHIIYSLSDTGKAAVVVPTGFITKTGIGKRIRQHLVENKMLAGVVSMPSNIFATTGTSVSILFLDKSNTEDVVLIDASNLGTKVKEGGNQKTVLSEEEEQKIIDIFNAKEQIDSLSVVVKYDELAMKGYSFSAGQYFEVKIDYVDITQKAFESKIGEFKTNLRELFEDSKDLDKQIIEQLESLSFE